MRKTIATVLLTSTFLSCSVNQATTEKSVDSADKKSQIDLLDSDRIKYMNTITEQELKDHLYIIASSKMEGRDTGSKGQKLAGEYLINTYKKIGLTYPPGATSFYQPIASKYMRSAWSPILPDSENIWTYIEGGELKDELVVVSAHYDHVGKKNNEIYFGADDNGSGTCALLEIADAFVQAKKNGHTPKRSILFLHVTAEEYGLHGSRYYTNNPLFPIENTVANVNIDMIGRRGHGQENNDNYVYVIGSDRLSTDLHKLSEDANNEIGLELNYKYNDLNDPNKFYYRSDHYNFAKKGIPAIFYFDGVHDDYHKTTDTADKIDYPLYTKRTKLAFSTTWKIANAENRPKVDKDGK